MDAGNTSASRVAGGCDPYAAGQALEVLKALFIGTRSRGKDHFLARRLTGIICRDRNFDRTAT